MPRPAKPMTAFEECADGALSLDDGAAFLALSRRELDRIIDRSELTVIYYRTKPRVLKRQLIERLARELEETRAAIARGRD